jgi:hypothetical protein
MGSDSGGTLLPLTAKYFIGGRLVAEKCAVNDGNALRAPHVDDVAVGVLHGRAPDQGGEVPAVKSLDSFEFAAALSLRSTKTLVLELARSEYVVRRENIIAV